MAVCYKCGSEISAEPPIGRSLECSVCSAPVRCCRNCVFYAPGAHWDCRESIPDAVLDKERANFCDYFRLNDRNPDPDGGTATPKRSGRDDFDALFS